MFKIILIKINQGLDKIAEGTPIQWLIITDILILIFAIWKFVTFDHELEHIVIMSRSLDVVLVVVVCMSLFYFCKSKYKNLKK